MLKNQWPPNAELAQKSHEMPEKTNHFYPESPNTSRKLKHCCSTPSILAHICCTLSSIRYHSNVLYFVHNTSLGRETGHIFHSLTWTPFLVGMNTLLLCHSTTKSTQLLRWRACYTRKMLGLIKYTTFHALLLLLQSSMQGNLFVLIL